MTLLSRLVLALRIEKADPRKKKNNNNNIPWKTKRRLRWPSQLLRKNRSATEIPAQHKLQMRTLQCSSELLRELNTLSMATSLKVSHDVATSVMSLISSTTPYRVHQSHTPRPNLCATTCSPSMCSHSHVEEGVAVNSDGPSSQEPRSSRNLDNTKHLLISMTSGCKHHRNLLNISNTARPTLTTIRLSGLQKSTCPLRKSHTVVSALTLCKSRMVLHRDHLAVKLVSCSNKPQQDLQ